MSLKSILSLFRNIRLKVVSETLALLNRNFCPTNGLFIFIKIN